MTAMSSPSTVLDVTTSPWDAVGDGITDDQPAIQRALDQALDRSELTVVLPGGHHFRVGHLRLHRNTTVVIDGVLVQSDDPVTYGYTPRRGHDLPGGSVLPYHLASRENLPLIHAGQTSGITVTGSGEIQLMGGSDEEVINVAPIGFHRVDDFEISGVRIRDSHSWNVMVYSCRRGTVRGLDITSRYRNSDGICILNSQDISVLDNTMDVDDDGIYVRTEYASPVFRPDIQWYSMRWPMPSTRITVRDNQVKSRTRGFTFIPWGAKAPDHSRIEISDIEVTRNHLEALLPVSSWTDDPTARGPFTSRADWQENAGDYDNHVPLKDITIVDNTYKATGVPTGASAHTEIRRLSRITNFHNDLGLLSWPGTDHDPETLDAVLPNGDFDLGGLAHWSRLGRTGLATPYELDDLPGLRLREAAQDRFFAPLAWGPAGWLSGIDGPARLFQGIGLKPRADGTTATYEFSIELVAGEDIRVTARLGDRTLATTTAEQGPATVRLEIVIEATANPVEVGVETVDGADSWAVLRGARIRQIGPRQL